MTPKREGSDGRGEVEVFLEAFDGGVVRFAVLDERVELGKFGRVTDSATHDLVELAAALEQYPRAEARRPVVG
jgi:hypothetical protein